MLADVGDQHLVDYESPIVSLPGELLQLIDPTNLDIRRLGAELVDCPAEPLTELPLPGYSDRSLLTQAGTAAAEWFSEQLGGQ